MAHSLSNEDLDHVLPHSGHLWEHLRGGRIFVAGASGFFGIWLFGINRAVLFL